MSAANGICIVFMKSITTFDSVRSNPEATFVPVHMIENPGLLREPCLLDTHEIRRHNVPKNQRIRHKAVRSVNFTSMLGGATKMYFGRNDEDLTDFTPWTSMSNRQTFSSSTLDRPARRSRLRKNCHFFQRARRRLPMLKENYFLHPNKFCRSTFL